MNKKLAAFFVGLYPLLTLLGIFLLFNFYSSEGIHFLGYSSVVYAFFLALDCQSSVVSICFLVWTLLFFMASVASYLELFLYKSCKVGLTNIAIDLIASIGFLLYLFINANYSGCTFVILGLLVRISLFGILFTANKEVPQ